MTARGCGRKDCCVAEVGLHLSEPVSLQECRRGRNEPVSPVCLVRPGTINRLRHPGRDKYHFAVQFQGESLLKRLRTEPAAVDPETNLQVRSAKQFLWRPGGRSHYRWLHKEIRRGLAGRRERVVARVPEWTPVP